MEAKAVEHDDIHTLRRVYDSFNFKNAVALLFLTLNDMLVERSGMLVNNFHK